MKCELFNDHFLEKWKPVIGYEGYYEVSNLGRVRSVDREIKQKKRNFFV